MICALYSNVNQAWLVVWQGNKAADHHVLRVFNDKGEADAYVYELELAALPEEALKSRIRGLQAQIVGGGAPEGGRAEIEACRVELKRRDRGSVPVRL